MVELLAFENGSANIEAKMFDTKEKIWCSFGDKFLTVSYDSGTPCRKGKKVFLLGDATREDGDFEIYVGKSWIGPICRTKQDVTIRESMNLWFSFPAKRFGKTPSDEDLKAVRKAVEEALSTPRFVEAVENILQDTSVSVVSRENAYYGD